MPVGAKGGKRPHCLFNEEGVEDKEVVEITPTNYFMTPIAVVCI